MVNFFRYNASLATILLVSFFVTLPLKNNINSISLILLTIVAAAKIQSFSFSRFKRFYPLILLFIVVALSLVYTENLSRGILYLQKYLVLLIIPFVFSTIDISKKTLERCFLFFTITILLLSIYCEVYAFYTLIENNDSFSSLLDKKYSYLNFSIPVDMHPAYFSLFIVASILSSYWFFLNQSKNSIKILCLTAILFFCCIIIQLASRTYLLILFIVLNWISCHYLYLVTKSKIKIFLMLIVANALLIVVVYNIGYTQKRIKQVFGYTYANGYKHEDGKNKLKQWSSATNANKNILFGNGIGDANKTILQEYESNKLIYFFKKEYNAHNQYIQFYVGLGAIGVFLLLFILIKGGHLAYQHNSKILFVFFLIVPIAFFTESYLERHHGYMFFTLMYSLIFLNSQKNAFLK